MRSLLRIVGGSRIMLIGVILVAVLAAMAVLAPLLSPYNPKAITGGAFEDPSSSHLLGTNDAGSDNLSRLLWGSRTALIVATTATAIILVVGVAVGATAALRGGATDTVLARVMDLFLAIPPLPVVIVVAAMAGPNLALTIALIAIFYWPQTGRIVRSQTLSLRARGFVDSAKGFGARPFYVIRRHLAPALGPIIGAQLVYVAGDVVIIEAALSFLGLGDPAVVSWGADIRRAGASPQIALNWLWLWWLLPLGLALSFAVFGFSLIGVGLEPEFNPRVANA